MKKNILSLNKCKLGIMSPTNSYMSRENIFSDVSNLGGELEFTFVFYILFHIIVYMSFFPHMR